MDSKALTSLSLREINLRIFQRLPVPGVFFQPRFEPWFGWHQAFNCMPVDYMGMSVRDLYDELGVSMRYLQYYTGSPSPVVVHFSGDVEVLERFEDEDGWRVFRTPSGDLNERLKLTIDREWRTVEFPVKSLDDLKKLRWLYQKMEYSFSKENFLQGSEFIGERGEPQFYLPRSPYQSLALNWMKLPDLIYALADDRGVVEDTMRAIDEAYVPLFEQISSAGLVKIINFGENIHEAHGGPRYFDRYLIPYYQKRAGQLRRAGIFSHIHIDGYFRSLLKFLKDLPFDGIEALTPTPQGDVTLEEIKEHIGDKILLDGIPAVMFLPPFSRQELMAVVERIVELFHPRLVLGVSDEVPEGADQDAIERVRMIARWCQQR